VTSVVIAAHNEETVIGRCLDGVVGPDVQVVVAPNGCVDNTAEIARQRPGIEVVELTQAGKAGALNAADAIAEGFPRFYVDADVTLPAGALDALRAALRQPGILAVAPRLCYDVRRRPLPVRAYYAIFTRLPAHRHALFGPLAVGLSEQGRERFERFPDLIADDLFLDSLFGPAEKRRVASTTVTVATPYRTTALLRRLVRVRAGSMQMRQANPGGTVRASNTFSWLRDVVLPRPWLLPAGVVYAAITVAAQVGARRALRDGIRWGQDRSTRAASPAENSVSEAKGAVNR